MRAHQKFHLKKVFKKLGMLTRKQKLYIQISIFEGASGVCVSKLHIQ